MNDICNLLPVNIGGLYLERTGYYRGYNQSLTMHLKLLKSIPSPQRQKSEETFVKFASDNCVICERIELKFDGKSMKTTRSFSTWKRKLAGRVKI